MAWAPSYCAFTDLQDWMQDGSNISTGEHLLAIEAASRAVDRVCNRQFGLVDDAEDRYYPAFYDRNLCRWVIEIDDLMTVTAGLAVTAASSEGVYDKPIDVFTLEPVNAAARARPWTRIAVGLPAANHPTTGLATVRVTARYGWTTVPDTIKLATMIQASRLFARRHAPFGVVGNPEVGEMRLLERLDVDLVTSVKPYVRVWGAA
jgi:hypothetical protein